MKRNRRRKSQEVEANSIRKIAPFSLAKLTPKRVVGVVATCVVLLLLYGGDIRRALTGHYNPRISFERGAQASGGGAPRRVGEPAAQGAVFDGEVYRTEGRLREASAVAIASSLSGVARSVERRPVRTVDELLDEIVRRGLLPPGVELVRERNMIVSERSMIHVRFRPEPFGVEIVSLGRERADGPGLLLRVPDENATPPQNARQRYFYSFRLENVSVPEAFAPASAVQAAGWQTDYMNAELPEGANAEQLAAWTRQPPSQNR
jgi:hypothetical protein